MAKLTKEQAINRIADKTKFKLEEFNDMFDNQTKKNEALTTSVLINEVKNTKNENDIKDYFLNKSKFLTMDDIAGTQVIDVSNIAWVESGTDLIATFTNELTPLKDNLKIEIDLKNDAVLVDTFNDGQETSQPLTINGVKQNVILKTKPAEFTLEGLGQDERAWVIANAGLKTIKQLKVNTNQSGIDQTARASAANALQIANEAKAKATSDHFTIDANGVKIAINRDLDTNEALVDKLLSKADKVELDLKADKADTYTKAQVDNSLTTAIAQKLDKTITAPGEQLVLGYGMDGNSNTITMSALKTALGIPTRKDITATYATRKWNANDAGKKVWITVSVRGIKVGFISEGSDTKFKNGGWW